MDFLKSAVASAISKGPPFPYNFGELIDLENSVWKLYNGTRREGDSNCSIFKFESSNAPSKLPIAKNALRKFRTLRHPGLVKVLDTVETETYIYIATERLTPLGWLVRRKALSVEATIWGLYTIANTLKFLNEEAASIHGNVRVSSIFISESGEWKLGGLDILSSMKEDDAILYTSAQLVPNLGRYLPPEVSHGGWSGVQKNPLSAPDSYQFGMLMFEVFNEGAFGGDQPGQTKGIPPTMQQGYKRLLNANPKARLSISHFVEQGRRNRAYFDTALIKLSEGVESLGLKDDQERMALLSELNDASEDFPEDFLKMKVLPELLKSVEFGGGGPKVFGFAMKIGAKLTEDEYEALLSPILLRLFASPDRQMRVCLLENLPQMIDHFSQRVVTDKIFPQLVTGFTDVAPVIREQTVKSVLIIITKLSDRVINGELLKYLAKTANDEQPGIRTNTTICLGKIARNIGASMRPKVLIAAFSRSLRDPFVHGRNAALQALAATSDLFTEEDCANKLLPAICPSLLDREKIVREQANKTLDIYLAKVRKHSSTMVDSVLPPPVPSSQTNGVGSRTNSPAPEPSWAGWAVSSFTNKLAAATGEIQAKAVPMALALADTSPAPRSSSVPPRPGADHQRVPKMSSSKLQRQAFASPTTSVAMSISTPPEDLLDTTSAEQDALDAAWGDPNDEFFDAPTTSVGNTTPTPFDDTGEPDFAAWLNQKAQAKSKAPLPRGLAKSKSSRPAVVKSISAAGVKQGSAIPTRLIPSPTKVIDTKPKEADGDDWGDAWG